MGRRLFHLGLCSLASLLYCLGDREVCARWQGSQVEGFASKELIVEVTL